MAKYRIVKGSEAILDPQSEDWIIPFRIQKQVYGIFPLKFWTFVNGRRIVHQHEGERVETTEVIDEPLNFKTEEDAMAFLWKQLQDPAPKNAVKWEPVREFTYGK